MMPKNKTNEIRYFYNWVVSFRLNTEFDWLDACLPKWPDISTRITPESWICTKAKQTSNSDFSTIPVVKNPFYNFYLREKLWFPKGRGDNRYYLMWNIAPSGKLSRNKMWLEQFALFFLAHRKKAVRITNKHFETPPWISLRLTSQASCLLK